MKTVLKDRVLWYDGINQVDPGLVPELLLDGVPIEKIEVTHSDKEIEMFNALSDNPIGFEKFKNEPLDMRWNIPQFYLDLDLRDAVISSLNDYALRNPAFENLDVYQLYLNRINEELMEINLRGMGYLFKTLIYVIVTFKESNTVWGVGRGSSCASLVLFILGLHKVDPIRFNIPMSEFFHE